MFTSSAYENITTLAVARRGLENTRIAGGLHPLHVLVLMRAQAREAVRRNLHVGLELVECSRPALGNKRQVDFARLFGSSSFVRGARLSVELGQLVGDFGGVFTSGLFVGDTVLLQRVGEGLNNQLSALAAERRMATSQTETPASIQSKNFREKI